MIRWMPALFVALLLTLAVFGVVADRALVEQEQTARVAAAARADVVAQGVARSARAALAEVEQSLVGGHATAGVKSDRLALSPSAALALGPFTPYTKRPREELSRLLASDGLTPNGLPEAVIARLILGEAVPVSGAEPGPRVEERLLSGQLPVRPEDLPELARRLGVAADPRVRSLQERLGRLPPAAELPALPEFRRASHGMPWDEALERILPANGYAARLAGPVLEIGEPAKLPAPRRFDGAPTDIDFNEVELVDALRQVAERGGRELSAGPEIGGKLTLRLVQVPWDQAFDLIARLNGLTWQQAGTTLRVQPR